MIKLITETEQQVDDLASSVLQLSESIKKISDNLIDITDKCNILGNKIYLLERDFEDRRITGFIKKTLFWMYCIFILSLIVFSSMQHVQLLNLISDIKSVLQIEF